MQFICVYESSVYFVYCHENNPFELVFELSFFIVFVWIFNVFILFFILSRWSLNVKIYFRNLLRIERVTNTITDQFIKKNKIVLKVLCSHISHRSWSMKMLLNIKMILNFIRIRCVCVYTRICLHFSFSPSLCEFTGTCLNKKFHWNIFISQLLEFIENKNCVFAFHTSIATAAILFYSVTISFDLVYVDLIYGQTNTNCPNRKKSRDVSQIEDVHIHSRTHAGINKQASRLAIARRANNRARILVNLALAICAWKWKSVCDWKFCRVKTRLICRSEHILLSACRTPTTVCAATI